MLSLHVVSDRTSVLFSSEGYHCSFHMEMLGVAQWRQPCCSKTYPGTVAHYFPEIAFCFMFLQPLERQSRGLIFTWGPHATIHCYLAFLISSWDYMGSLFGHSITLDKATWKNNIYLFLYKTGRLERGDLQHLAPTAETKREPGFPMQATLTCNANLDETGWKGNKYSKPAAAQARAGKAGEKVILDKAQQCWLSFKAQLWFGHCK